MIKIGELDEYLKRCKSSGILVTRFARDGTHTIEVLRLKQALEELGYINNDNY